MGKYICIHTQLLKHNNISYCFPTTYLAPIAWELHSRFSPPHTLFTRTNHDPNKCNFLLQLSSLAKTQAIHQQLSSNIFSLVLLLVLLLSPIFRVLVFIAYQPYARCQIHIGIICSYSNSNKSVTYFHWKILALAGIWTRDLPGTKPICYQFSYLCLDPQELFASLGTRSKHPQVLVECSSNMNKKIQNLLIYFRTNLYKGSNSKKFLVHFLSGRP